MEHRGYWASLFLLCVWGIAKNPLCHKRFQSRGITNQGLFIPGSDLSVCTEELEASWILSRAVSLWCVPGKRTLCSRGAGDKTLKSPWKQSGCFHYYLEESSYDNLFLCSHHDGDQMYSTDLSLAQKQAGVKWEDVTFPWNTCGNSMNYHTALLVEATSYSSCWSLAVFSRPTCKTWSSHSLGN